MSTDDVVNKVRKLLNLSQRTSNVHEAATAAAAAQALMLHHKLAMADVETKADPMAEVNALGADQRRVTRWQVILMAGICRANFCRCVVRAAHKAHPGGLTIVGKASDVNAVLYLYQYLSRQLDELADGAYVPPWQSKREFMGSFRYGAACEVAHRLYEERQRAEAELRSQGATAERSLMVINQADAEVGEYVDKRFAHKDKDGSVKPPKQYRVAQTEGGGYSAGRIAGSQIRLGAGPGLPERQREIGGKR